MCAPAPALASQIFLTSHIFLTCVHPRLRPLAPAPAPAPWRTARGGGGGEGGVGGRLYLLFAGEEEGLIKDLNGKAAGRLQKGDGGTRGYSRLEMGEIVLLVVFWFV